MYAKVLAESLMNYRECFLFLVINRKILRRQALSSVENSVSKIAILLSGCLLLNKNQQTA